MCQRLQYLCPYTLAEMETTMYALHLIAYNILTHDDLRAGLQCRCVCVCVGVGVGVGVGVSLIQVYLCELGKT